MSFNTLVHDRMPNDSSGNLSGNPTPRFLSESDCAALLQRAAQLAAGGGITSIALESVWSANLRFGRNQFTSTGDLRDNMLTVGRMIRRAYAETPINAVDDLPLEAALRRAERLLRLDQAHGDDGEYTTEHYLERPVPQPPAQGFRLDSATRASAVRALQQTPEVMPHPQLFFDATFTMDAGTRAEAVAPLIRSVKDAGMYAAGYMQIEGRGRSLRDTAGKAMYYPATTAQYTVTVRDPKGTGSGWAGVDWNEWARIDSQKLTAIALDKCLRSRNPVALEPGRYTAILEPQAVCDLCANVIRTPEMFTNSLEMALDGGGPYQYGKRRMATEARVKLGERVFDERITITSDPMDPDCGFVPFNLDGDVFHATTWVEHGILKNLSYDRWYAIEHFGKNEGQQSGGAMHMSGSTTTLDEMVATTKRGVYVTRFSDVTVVDGDSLLSTGYTRDGTWLVENGKITHAIKNFRFTESPMFSLNKVQQLGVPQRVFHPSWPVVVPPLKVSDFSFTALSEAV